MNRLFLLLIFLMFSSCLNILSQEEQKQSKERYTKAQSTVSNWIKENALYPDSYESLSFGEYSETVSKMRDEIIPNTENYIIKHTHKILDKDSNLTTFSGYFILNYDYSINLIETVRSNSIGSAYSKQTQIWTDNYGKPLSLIDSIDIDKQQKEQTKKIIKDLKSGIEKGDIYTADPKDMEQLKSVIDKMESKE